MSQSKGSTVLCELELHALSKKTMLNISLNPGLNLTIILGTGPRMSTRRLKLCLKKHKSVPIHHLGLTPLLIFSIFLNFLNFVNEQ